MVSLNNKEKNKQKKKKSYKYINITIVLLTITIGAGGYYYVQYKNQIALKEKIEKQKELAIKAKKEEQKRKQAELQKLFDTYLNDFKDELRAKVTDYKKSRKVLNNFKSPYNYETLEYTKENYKLFKQSIAPSLRQKAAEIIEIFEKYDHQINNDLKNKNGELQQTFLKEWKEMSHTQLIKYVDFFSKEEDLIQAYDDLITFYYTNSKRYKVDGEANKFIFTSKIAEKMNNEMLERIDALSK